MPRPTTWPQPPASPAAPVRSPARTAGAVVAAATAFAAAELLAGIGVGGFLASGRAEALIFLAFRPWLLLVAALLASRAGGRQRCAFYALALLLAAASETLLVFALGARAPWPEMLRGLAAGAGLVLVADAVVQLGRRFVPRVGALLGFALLLAAALFAGALRPVEAIVLGPPPPAQARERPPLLMMTALPLVWGEGGAFDAESRPDPAYRYLQREFDVRPIDAIEPAALAGARLMLLAQPRLLAPEEMVTLDDWVRGGGRLLVLTDPQLDWPSRLPPGDVRRPPHAGLLGPLLAHWGLRLEAPPNGAVRDERPAGGEGPRRLLLVSPGRFATDGTACRVAGRGGVLARCRIGRGEAMLVADADLLAERLWAAHGTSRWSRQSDAPLLVAEWLDALAGISRGRVEPPVAWADPQADHGRALLLAALPLAAVLLAGLALLVIGRRSPPTTLSTGLRTENRPRTSHLADP